MVGLMVHCREEISSVTVLPGCSGSPPVSGRVQEFVAEENTAELLNQHIAVTDAFS